MPTHHMKTLASLLILVSVGSIASLCIAFSPVHKTRTMPVNQMVGLYDYTLDIAAEMETAASDSDFATIDEMLDVLRTSPTNEIFVHFAGGHESGYAGFESEVEAMDAIARNQ